MTLSTAPTIEIGPVEFIWQEQPFEASIRLDVDASGRIDPDGALSGKLRADGQVKNAVTLLRRMGLIENGLKLLVSEPPDRSDPETDAILELYDLGLDPGEAQNQIRRQIEAVRHLRARIANYEGFAARADATRGSQGADRTLQDLDLNTRQALQQLGYLDSTLVLDEPGAPNEPDDR